VGGKVYHRVHAREHWPELGFVGGIAVHKFEALRQAAKPGGEINCRCSLPRPTAESRESAQVFPEQRRRGAQLLNSALDAGIRRFGICSGMPYTAQVEENKGETSHNPESPF
jgi:hypothetical protein